MTELNGPMLERLLIELKKDTTQDRKKLTGEKTSIRNQNKKVVRENATVTPMTRKSMPKNRGVKFYEAERAPKTKNGYDWHKDGKTTLQMIQQGIQRGATPTNRDDSRG